MVDACVRSNLVSLLLINVVVKASLFICKIVKGPKNTKQTMNNLNKLVNIKLSLFQGSINIYIYIYIYIYIHLTPISPIPANIPSNLQSPTSPASTSPHTSHFRENSAVSFHDPTHLEESNLQSSIPTPDMDTTDEDLPLLKIVIGGSKKGETY